MRLRLLQFALTAATIALIYFEFTFNAGEVRDHIAGRKQERHDDPVEDPIVVP